MESRWIHHVVLEAVQVNLLFLIVDSRATSTFHFDSAACLTDSTSTPSSHCLPFWASKPGGAIGEEANVNRALSSVMVPMYFRNNYPHNPHIRTNIPTRTSISPECLRCSNSSPLPVLDKIDIDNIRGTACLESLMNSRPAAVFTSHRPATSSSPSTSLDLGNPTDYSFHDTSATASPLSAGSSCDFLFASPRSPSRRDLSLPFRSPSLPLRPSFRPENVKTIQFNHEGGLQSRHVFYHSETRHVISPWNDIPLYSDIRPDSTSARMEVSDYNGTSADKSSRLLHFICTTPVGTWMRRHVADAEPCHPLRVPLQGNSHYNENAGWNLGILPQTSELGGNFMACPIDVIDISACRIRAIGDVYPVKPLGAFITREGPERRIRWKIIAISAEDSMAYRIDDVADIEKELPRNLELIRNWLKRSGFSGDQGEISNPSLTDITPIPVLPRGTSTHQTPLISECLPAPLHLFAQPLF